MTLEDIKRLADEANITIEGSILELPIERQQEIAKELGFKTFELYVNKQIADFVNSKESSEETESMTGREFIDSHPLEKRYAAAAFCGRVYTRDSSPEEVLKLSGYSDKEIEDIIRADENNQIPA